MDLVKKYSSRKGFTRIIKPGDGGLEFTGFGILGLASGEKYSGKTEGNEEFLVVLGGTCEIIGKNFEYKNIGKRENVFSGKPYSVYLSRGVEYEVTAVTDVEIAVSSAPSSLDCPARLFTPDDVKEVTIGRDNWTRDAYIILDESAEASYLFIGEALVPSGNWASYPPHRHDYDNLPNEVNMEEIYFFRFNPENGFGIQKVYTDDRSIDETYTIEQNDTVILPRGYHPVVAAPGYSLYYLWIMAGKNRKFLSCLDPEHKWVAEK